MKPDRLFFVAMFCASMTMACASPDAKVTDRLEAARSWMATVEMVGGLWAANRVPSRYADRTLTEALEAMESADRALASAEAKRDVSAQARQRIARAGEITRSLLGAIKANDRRAAPGSIGLLAVERDALDLIIERAARQ